ncbi:unnamed protein product [Chironomus riparius]|uniref:Chromo domain-containing protein n=1 Tax=Chironomus riparius TaxID=315576 RepID=A0A9N9S5W2_9DIPT|nr:unnamed protein product [Chironomus riparius]
MAQRSAHNNDLDSDPESDREYREPEHVVEKILDKIIINSRVYYEVKWVGFANLDNSLVLGERLNCCAMIREFEEQRKKQEEAKEWLYTDSGEIPTKKRKSTRSKK